MKKENINFKRLMAFAIVASMCLVVVPTVSADCPPEMVAYWKFDEGIGSDAYDETTNDNDGILSGGKFGNGLQFDGIDDYVNVLDSTSLDLTGELTIEAWVYPEGYQTSYKNNYIIDKYHTIGFVLRASPASDIGKVSGFVFIDGIIHQIMTDEAIPLNTWTHIAFTRDITTGMHLYIDGTEKSITVLHGFQNPIGSIDDGGDLRIGMYLPSPANYRNQFKGKLDEVRISNTAYTTFTISQALSVVSGETAALWHFNESIDPTVYDETTDNNGTIYGATWAGPTWTTGKVDSALEFDGVSDYVSTSFNAETDIGDNNPFTIEAWVFPEEIQGIPFSRMVVASMDSSQPGNPRFYFGVHQGYWRWGIGSEYITNTGVTATANVWQHIAWVYDGSNVKIYVDGELKDDRTYTGDGNYPNLDVKIGALTRQPGYSPPITNYFDGYIDELAIYNTALSCDEIYMHYCLGEHFGLGYCDEPSLTYSGNLIYPYGNSIILQATLTDSTGTGMQGYDVEFYIDGEGLVGTNETDGDGIAELDIGTKNVNVYEITAKLHCLENDTVFLAVYDPTEGFVTGGGWIYSDPGAYKPDPTLEGKANFGFVSKYKKGQSTPSGNTEFQFKAGDLNFHSSSYEWLVIAGAKAMYKGTGTINGAGSYKFMITAWDGQLNGGDDTFRIKIWEEDEFGDETIIYDNGTDTQLGGGQIKIHQG